MATDMIMWAVGEELGAILKEEASYMQQVCDSHMRSYALLPRPRRKISEPAQVLRIHTGTAIGAKIPPIWGP